MYVRRLFGLRDRQVEGFRARKFTIRAGGIEMGVVWDDVALLAHDAEQDAFRGAALMRGNDVTKTEDTLDGIAKAREARRARVRFIATHHGGPLFGGHGGGSGVREEVNQNGVGRDKKQIVAGRFQQPFALGGQSAMDWLDALDAKRFNDSSNGHT